MLVMFCFIETTGNNRSPGSTLVSPASRDAIASDEHGLGVRKKSPRSAAERFEHLIK